MGEMRDKLRRRAERESDVNILIDRLKDCGYLDDAKFAETFAAARLSNNGIGRTRVINDLRARRVAPGLAQETVARIYQDTDDETLIEEWIRRKYRTVPRENLFQTEKDVASAYRGMMRAGFPTGPIRKILKRLAKNPELLDTMEPPEEPIDSDDPGAYQ